MSDATKTALDDAIAAHFADVLEGAIVHGYMLQVSGDSLEDVENNQWSSLRVVADGQAFITTLGLAAYAKRNLELVMTQDDG